MALIPDLSFDVQLNILKHIPSDDTGTQTLTTCLTVSRSMNLAASTSSIWETRYHERYKHSKPGSQASEETIDYKSLYASRVKLDQHCASLLNDLIHAQSNVDRVSFINKIADLDWDVWDLLAREAARPIPVVFSQQGNHSNSRTHQSNSEDRQIVRALPLTWRYWCQTLQRSIGTRYALKKWHELLQTTRPDPALCEESLNATSCFYSYSPFDLAQTLDDLAVDCRSFIEGDSQRTLDPEADSYDLPEICMKITEFMVSRGFTAATGDDFRRTENSLPHCYLNGPDKSTIPLSLVHVFVAIARRLGLEAYYVNYPNRLLACVVPPSSPSRSQAQSFPTSDHIPELFIDVYQPHLVPPTSLLSTASSLGVPWPDLKSQILLSPNYDILLRSTGNILACPSTDRKSVV